jgi:predicted transposase/invertase (TIGR01784 family)
MKKVAPLRYGTIFKKAFSEKEIFTAFVRDVLGIEIEIEKVEMEKTFKPSIGNVAVEFDLYAEDKKNRVIIDIQHKRDSDHYDRFFHYLCVALLEQVKNNYNYNYRPNLAVFSIVVLTSGDKHATDVSIIDCDPHDLKGNPLGEIPHKVIYLCPKYMNQETPEPLQEWMRAIQDSLDEQVDESQYTKPEILRVFEIIEKDLISPEERAKMFAEYNQQETIGEAYSEGLEKGLKEGEQKKALEIASNLLAGGLAPEQVARFSGLSLSEVEALVKVKE